MWMVTHVVWVLVPVLGVWNCIGVSIVMAICMVSIVVSVVWEELIALLTAAGERAKFVAAIVVVGEVVVDVLWTHVSCVNQLVVAS